MGPLLQAARTVRLCVRVEPRSAARQRDRVCPVRTRHQREMDRAAKEIAPRVTRAAVLLDTTNPAGCQLRAIKSRRADFTLPAHFTPRWGRRFEDGPRRASIIGVGAVSRRSAHPSRPLVSLRSSLASAGVRLPTQWPSRVQAASAALATGGSSNHSRKPFPSSGPSNRRALLSPSLRRLAVS